MTDSNCIFCKIVANQIPSRIVFENDEFLCFMDINPVSDGHCLLIPKTHSASISEMTNSDAVKLMQLMHRLAPVISKSVGASSFNLITNSGVESGQEVFHTHFHITPRKEKTKTPWKQSQPSKEHLDSIFEAIKVGVTKASL